MGVTTPTIRTRPLPGRPGGSVSVVLPPDIDVTNAAQLREDLLRVLNTEPALLVIDMSATRFCAVAGVHALLRAWRRACATHTELRIAVREPTVRRILTLTGTHHLMGLYPSAAIAGTVSEGQSTASEVSPQGHQQRQRMRNDP